MAFGEAAHASKSAERAETVAPACQNLVCVGLMSDIPDDFIDRCFEDTVQGDGQFYHPQSGCKMATV